MDEEEPDGSLKRPPPSSDSPCSKVSEDPLAVPGYGSGAGYWDDRYSNDPETFEWLEGFAGIQGMIRELTDGNRASRVLHPGCGNSAITERMYDDGYRYIVNCDISQVVIRQMQEANKHRPGMTWLAMDCTDMQLEDGSFDLVIDKSVLDTFACMDHAQFMAGKYLREVLRLLRPGGSFLCVSYGDPPSRLRFLEMPHLDFELRTVTIAAKTEGNNPHYGYIGRKPLIPTGAEARWPEVLESITTIFD